jgi:hypothetical protein
MLVSAFSPEHAQTDEGRQELRRRVTRAIASIDEKLREWSDERPSPTPRILVDKAERAPYKSFQDSKGPLNQIRIRVEDGSILDMAESSRVVASIETFELYRAYCDEGDAEARREVTTIVENEMGSEGYGN